DRIHGHVMLPVLIEHEGSRRAGEEPLSGVALLAAVRGQLQALTGDAEPISEELLRHLLRRQRILVIVDHYGELSTAFHADHADFPVAALVIAARRDEALVGVPKTVLQPLRIEGSTLSAFLEGYLTQRGQRQSFDAPEYFEACRRLALLAGRSPITALF